MAQGTLDIEVLTVGTVVHTKTARGGYNSLEVAFKNHSFEGKVEGKKLIDFNNKAVFEFFKNLKQGDRVIVTKEKGEGEQYWQWVKAVYASEAQGDSAVSGEAGAPVSPQEGVAGTADKQPARGGRVIGDNRETPEERAKRQILIVRQSSVSNAIEYIKMGGITDATPVTVGEVVAVAKQFEAYVFGEEKTEVPF